MSVTDVTSRIGAIQAQLATLTPTRSASSSAAAFAASLSRAGLTPETLAAITGDTTGVATTGTGTTGEQVVDEARKYLDMPYVWGGDDPGDGGMDCSGLVQHVYEQFGIDLPRVSADQARAGTPVASMAEARPGDLIAWDNSSRNVGADHIAIYAGDGMMIEAPRTGLDIRLVPVPSTPDYIRRVLPESGMPGVGAVGGIGGTGGTAPATAMSTATPSAPTPYDELFAAAGARYGVDPAVLTAVARQESGFDPRAVSPAGAQGLMQLMPGTAAGLGVTDSFDPVQAVDGAARLLRDLLQRFGQLDLALAGYNAGPGAVLRYDGIPPYPETQNYVRSIMADLGRS